MTDTYSMASDIISDKDARTLEALQKATGYIPSFISEAVPVTDNLLNETQQKYLPLINNKKAGKLTYTNLSVFYNTQRRVPFYSAYNIDLRLKSQGKRADKFKPDPRISDKFQLSYKQFYDLVKDSDKDFDIGHMAGSDEMAWDTNGQLKSLQTFFFPNTCPQAAALNQKLWNQMERKLVTAQQGKEEGKIAVFTGPIIDKNDPFYVHENTFQIPMRFFKVIVFEYKKKVYATALIMSHINIVKSLGLIIEKAATKPKRLNAVQTPIDDFPYKGIYQVNPGLVSQLTGIGFSWPGVTPVNVPEKYNALQNIDEKETPADVGRERLNAIVRENSPNPANPLGFVLVK